MIAERVRCVLVGSRSAGNVGAAARALKNLGFPRLVLVAPRCDPQDAQARRMAVDAVDVLDAAARFDALDPALDGAGIVIGATALTGKHRRPHYRLDRLVQLLGPAALANDLALVFGREDRGLTDRELDRCTHLVRLPAVEAYPSFNLAQAVLLVAWELRRAALEAEDPPPADAAGHREREAMYAHLEQALREIGFLKDDPAEVVMRRLRRLLGRAVPTADEVRLLRGIARQTLWAAGRARRDDA